MKPDSLHDTVFASVRPKTMTQRRFNIISVVSLAFAVLTFGLWIATFWISPWDHRISFTEHFHVGVWSGVSGDSLGCLVVFNNAKYGPYRGSIISLADPNHPSVNWGWSVGRYGFGQMTDFDPKGKVSIREKACDLPGIYFRHIRWQNEGLPLWTLMVSLWYPLLLFSVLPLVWMSRRWRSRHKAT